MGQISLSLMLLSAAGLFVRSSVQAVQGTRGRIAVFKVVRLFTTISRTRGHAQLLPF
jgi:hypothetical protein